MAQITELGALRVVDPKKWESTIRRAMREAEGHTVTAAEILGVSRRQLQRWLAELPDVPRLPPHRPPRDE